MSDGSRDLWVFGYGSLMWQPGFAFVEAHHASLTGYHRSFCVYSIHYRGSPRRPGLVLGLDRGGMCEGRAFRVAAAGAEETLSYLRRRELIYGVYREAIVPLTLLIPGRPAVRAVTYIAERAHPAHAGRLRLATQVRLIRGARGVAGANLDYLVNTLGHLAEFGVRERALERLLANLGAFVARAEPQGLARPRSRALAASWSSRRVEAPSFRPDQRRRFIYRKCFSAL